MAALRIGVLVSGQGTNLQAIIDACARGELPAVVAVVISNRPRAYALARARRAGIPARALSLAGGRFEGARERDLAMAALLREHGVDLVVTAGYDRVLAPEFVDAFAGRIVNVHPSLLPAFGGGMAPQPQADALAAGVKIAGCTVHFVTNHVDAGPIVVQAAVPVLDDDTVEELAARVLAQEHRALVTAIRLFSEGRLRIVGRRVHVDGAAGAWCAGFPGPS